MDKVSAAFACFIACMAFGLVVCAGFSAYTNYHDSMACLAKTGYYDCGLKSKEQKITLEQK